MSDHKDTSSLPSKIASRLDTLPLEVHHVVLDYCMAEAIMPVSLSYSDSSSEERTIVDASCTSGKGFQERFKMPSICKFHNSCRLYDLRQVLCSDNLTIMVDGFDDHSLQHLWVSTRKLMKLSNGDIKSLDVHFATCTTYFDINNLASWTWYFRFFAPHLSGRVTFAPSKECHIHHAYKDEAEALLQALAALAMQDFREHGVMTEEDVNRDSLPDEIWRVIRSYPLSSDCKEYQDLYHRADDLLQEDMWGAWGFLCPLPTEMGRHRSLSRCPNKDGVAVEAQEEALDGIRHESKLTEIEGGRFGIEYLWIDDRRCSEPW